ncbi:MAG: hypothetical protein Q4A16_02185 [Lautropia sp.]|nr:hypothetical protein [Lautropia sp.]
MVDAKKIAGVSFLWRPSWSLRLHPGFRSVLLRDQQAMDLQEQVFLFGETDSLYLADRGPYAADQNRSNWRASAVRLHCCCSRPLKSAALIAFF